MPSLHAAVEDRFLVFRLAEMEDVLPSPEEFEAIRENLKRFKNYQVVLDCRGVDRLAESLDDGIGEGTTWELPKDVLGFAGELLSEGAHLLYELQSEDLIKNVFPSGASLFPVHSKATELDYQALDLRVFDDEPEEKMRSVVQDLIETPFTRDELEEAFWSDPLIREVTPTIEEFGEHIAMAKDPLGYPQRLITRNRYLGRFIKVNNRKSLLTSFVLRPQAGTIGVNAMHCNSCFSVESRSELIIAKPSVLASRVQAVFHDELEQFRYLVSDSETTEHNIQEFLETHPQFLLNLGYTRFKAQVILERDNDGPLKPDFMLEPITGGFWDVLDIKLPDVNLVVGRDDRKRFSSAVGELAAQLREYGAHFEDPNLAERVYKAYGIRGYHPRLIGIIGRAPEGLEAREESRILSAYRDVQILTFSDIERVARERLLI